MRAFLALDLTPALRIARGFALAAACAIAAAVSAVAAHILVRALAFVADAQPELFLLTAFAGCLFAFVRFAFRRTEEF